MDAEAGAKRGAFMNREPPETSWQGPARFAPFCLALMAAMFLLWFWRLDPWIVYDPRTGMEDDPSYYLVLAKALSTGHGYRLISHPEQPWHRYYAPGYPAIVGALLKVLGNSSLPAAVLPAKVVSLLFVVAALPVLLLYGLRRREGATLTLCAGILFMLNPLTITYAGAVMAEAAFTFSSLLALLLCHHLVDRASLEGRDLRWAEIGALAAGITAAFYFRPVGVAVPAAVIAFLLAKGRGRDAVGVTGAVLVLVMPWLFISFHGYRGRTIGAAIVVAAAVGLLVLLRRHPLVALGAAAALFFGAYGLLQFWGGGPAYTYFATSVERNASYGLGHYLQFVVKKARDYALLYAKATLGGSDLWLEGRPLLAKTGLIVGAVFLFLGWLDRMREDLGAAEIYAAFYTLVLLVTDPPAWMRYAFPLVPFLLFYFLRGVGLLVRAVSRPVAAARPRPAAWAVPAILTVIVAVNYLPVQARLAAWATLPMGHRVYDRGEEGWWEAVWWIKDHTPSDAIVLSRTAAIMHIYTGRKTARWLLNAPPKVTAQHIVEIGAGYVVEDARTGPDLGRYLRPALAVLASDGKAELVHTTAGPLPSRIWRVIGDHRGARHG